MTEQKAASRSFRYSCSERGGAVPLAPTNATPVGCRNAPQTLDKHEFSATTTSRLVRTSESLVIRFQQESFVGLAHIISQSTPMYEFRTNYSESTGRFSAQRWNRTGSDNLPRAPWNAPQNENGPLYDVAVLHSPFLRLQLCGKGRRL